MTLIMGIDPGMSGAVSVLPVDHLWRVKLEPVAYKFADLTEKQIADVFWKVYYDATNAGESVAAILEHVHAMPAVKQWKDKDGVEQTQVMRGSVGTFKLGQSFGLLRGVLATIGIPYELVVPQSWQKLLGCRTKGDKRVSRDKARQLFPNGNWTHATSDSVLLCEYGRRVKAGGPLFSGSAVETMLRAAKAAPWETVKSSPPI